MSNLRLALAQTNPTVGDLEGNSAQILEIAHKAQLGGADLVVFGEMALTGYPIEDLASRESFLVETQIQLDAICRELQKDQFNRLTVVIGHPALASEQARTGWAIAQNCASVIQAGKVIGRYAKHHLPNYSVFDEYRIFVPGSELLTFKLKGLNISTVICEDIWQNGGPVADLTKNGTDLCLILNGSPFEIDKDAADARGV